MGDPAPALIDCSVHHHWPTQVELMSYMAPAWRAFLGKPGAVPGGGLMPLLGQLHPRDGTPYGPYPNPYGDKHPDTFPEGAPPGSSPALVVEQLLDPRGVERALLTHDVGVLTASLPNPRLASQVASACNDWTIDRWLDDGDGRFHGTALVCTQLPDEAAAEVRRVGEHPRMAGVLLAASGLDKPFGHPVYHPIYAAAAERGLVLVLSAGGNAMPEQLSHSTAGGEAATYAEFDALASQGVTTHVTSMIAQGVFDAYPSLKLLVVGCGVTWATPLMWRFDTDYKGLRREAPWMKELPSEYFRRHVRVGTHPLESVPSPERLGRYLEAFGGLEDVLCFASGYPRWDYDDGRGIERLPEAWRDRVAGGNARALFGWDADVRPQSPTRSESHV